VVSPAPARPLPRDEVRQARFSERQRRAKRLFDLAVVTFVLILAAPLSGAAAIAVKLASPGPVFFTQTREGMRGEPVRIFKIRSMVTDAEKRLAQHLANDPAARAEYEATLKFRNDPRIIPGIGSFIRRTSIDEMP
jgi:lipopolysaccharide/colanic/teichoic acid biosynthesis glycosyltransferase